MKGCTQPALHIVVLAAGFSARLGRPKALIPVNGLNLLSRTWRAVRPFAGPRSIIVIVPPRAARYRASVPPRAARLVANHRRTTGQSSSVRLGLRESRFAAGILVLPVDLVELARRDLARLIRRWRGGRRKVVARRLAGPDGRAGGIAATPLIVPRWLVDRARSVDGDRGLRDFVRSLTSDAIRLVPMPSADADIDTRADLSRARRRPNIRVR